MQKIKIEAHGRLLRRSRSVIDERVARHQCLGKLGVSAIRPLPRNWTRHTYQEDQYYIC